MTSPNPSSRGGEKFKLIIITGPTASGKTALSLKLAKKFGGEIISADSRQIYRGMDIGTAKPTKKELRSVQHHLIDIKNPNQNYTLAEWKQNAIKAANDITRRGKIPFLVGGTPLYINALINNLDIPEVKPNPKLRKKIAKLSASDLYKKLIKLDPAAANIIDPKNQRRIIRALEIMAGSKKLFSESRRQGPLLFDFIILGVDLPQKKLKANISERTEKMFKQGLINEIKKAPKSYDRKILVATIGYGETMAYLEKKLTKKQAIEKINQNTWGFAKRQMTWFKKMPITWIGSQKQAEKQIRAFLAKAY